MTLLYVMSRSRRQVSSALSLGELSDGEIYQMTRLPRSAVEELCRLMTDDLQRPSVGAYALTVDTQVLAALQFYASGSFQWMIGRRCRLSQSSVSAAVGNVTEALVRRAISRSVQGRRQGYRPGWAKFGAKRRIFFFVCPPWFSVCPPCHT